MICERFLVSALVAFLAGTASGQDPVAIPGRYSATRWTVADGLPVNHLNDVVQTPDGYVWVASLDGLARFDGHRFTIFTAANTGELPTSRIARLHLDQAGSVWAFTEQRSVVRVFDGRLELLMHRGRPVVVNGPVPRLEMRFYEAPDTSLWLATEAGVLRVVNGAVEAVHPETISGAVNGIGPGPDGSVWVALAEGFAFRVWPDGAVERFGRTEGLGPEPVIRVLTDDFGRTWATTLAGIERLEGGRFRPETIFGRAISDMYEYAFVQEDGNPWFGTGGGAAYRIEDGRLRYVAHTDSIPFERVPGPASVARAITTWAASFDPGTRRYQLFLRNQPVHEFDEQISGFWAADHREAWLATSNGLVHLRPTVFQVFRRPEPSVPTNAYPVLQDLDGGVWLGLIDFEVLRFTSSRTEVWSATTKNLTVGHPWALHRDRAGQIWVGGYGLCRLKPEPVECPPAGMRVPGIGEVRAILEDSQGRFWVGAEGGLAVRIDSTWSAYNASTPGVSHGWVRAIHEARDGTVWFGTNGGGLFRFKDDAFQSFSLGDGFCSDLVRDIHETDAGDLWVATEDRGLCRVSGLSSAELSAADVRSVGEAQGLFQGGIHAIVEDDSERYWLSSNRGIGFVYRAELEAAADDPSRGVHSVVFDHRDGMLSREANGGVQPAGLKDRLGRVWFPTQDGVVMVDPSQIPDRTPRKVVIESVLSGGVQFDPLEPVELSSSQRDLAISYTYPDFSKPEGLRFQYRLVGSQDEWYQAGTDRIARFTNLEPGQFTFEVRLAEGMSGSAETSATLSVSRTARFVETQWFLLVLGLLAGLLGSGVGWFRNTRLRARNLELEDRVQARTTDLREALDTVATQAEELKSLDEAKSRFFANVSHELRTPLTMILGPLRGLLDGTHGPLPDAVSNQHAVMLRNSRRLLRLVNQVLDLAQLDSGTLRLRVGRYDLPSFVERLVDAFRPVAEQQRIELSIELDPPRLEAFFDPQHLEVVLLNLVSNAIKFTPQGGRVRVTVSGGTEGVQLSVADTGRGIAPESVSRVFERFYQEEGSHGTGIGLTLVKELVELHGGRVEVESKQGSGTRFTVHLRAGSEHFDPGWLTGDGDSALVDDSVPGEATAAADTEKQRSNSVSRMDHDEDVTAILVAEDNPDVRAYLADLLAPNYRVLTARDGLEAQQMAREQLPDLILSDVMMPRLDGLALSKSLKGDPMTAHIPVILLTAKASRTSALQGLETGADDYLTKPFDPNELLVRIRNQLATRQSLRARFAEAAPQSEARPPLDQDTLEARCAAYILSRLGDPALSVQDIAEAVNMTYATLNRHLASEAGVRPNELVRRIRLREAAVLLKEGAGTVSEVAYGVGFNNLSYFARCFKEQFGVLPSAYA